MSNPSRYEARDTLLDGSSVRIRAIRPDDKAALQEGMHRLSRDSAYFRFFRVKHELSAKELVHFTEVDFVRHVALVACVTEQGEERLVGVGRYIVPASEPGLEHAEIAFAVDDAHHGLGIATILLRHLAEIARAAGLRRFTASVLARNQKMLEVFSHCGLRSQRTLSEGEYAITLWLDAADAGAD